MYLFLEYMFFAFVLCIKPLLLSGFFIPLPLNMCWQNDLVVSSFGYSCSSLIFVLSWNRIIHASALIPTPSIVGHYSSNLMMVLNYVVFSLLFYCIDIVKDWHMKKLMHLSW